MRPLAETCGIYPLAETCGIYPLASHHLPALQQLASDRAVAATTRIPHPYPADGAERFFAQMQAEREAGTARVLALEDAGKLIGLVGVHRIDNGTGELGFWIGAPFWGRGYASFAVRTVMSFAFEHLRLASLWAESLAGNVAAHRVLQKVGFVEGSRREHRDAKWPADQQLVRFSLTPAQWRTHRDAPALTDLHPLLRTILQAELAAGNEVKETSRGWPDDDSVLITLRHTFRALPSPLPEGVTYGEPNDSHWWKAELSTQAPRHLLVW